MQYSLRMLVLLTAIGPPAIALVWFAWWPLLLLALCIAALTLWIAGTLTICRFVAALFVSVMG
ncbi:MAG TPA: hypothetical protein VFB80_01610 [Pirellulaceae bacterium]|nr:hypothetical protein [Pirellulaceae bacterium]